MVGLISTMFENDFRLGGKQNLVKEAKITTRNVMKERVTVGGGQ